MSASFDRTTNPGATLVSVRTAEGFMLRLAEVRRHRGITHQHLVEQLRERLQRPQLRPETVSRWLSGRQSASPAVLLEIADLLEIDPASLYIGARPALERVEQVA